MQIAKVTSIHIAFLITLTFNLIINKQHCKKDKLFSSKPTS